MALDFSAITSAFGSGAGNAEASTWNITPSSFRNVPFHTFTAPDNGDYQAAMPRVQDKYGRRKVLYEFPFKDGQTTGDLGRKGNSYAFDVLFFGVDYLTGYEAFVAALDQAGPGILVHPVLGNVSCVSTDWEVTHESQERLCLTMHVSFVEHTYTVGAPTPGTKPNAASTGISAFRSAVINAVKVFQQINAAVTFVQANKAFAQSFINGVVTQMENYQSEVATTLQSLYLTFSTPGSPQLATDLPGVLPVALGGSSSNIYPLVNQSSTPFAQVPTSSNTQTIPAAIATIQGEAEVNARRAEAQSIIDSLNGAGGGQGAIDFYDQVLAIKQSAIAIQSVLEQGVASSQAQVADFTVPRLMSLREVTFLIGLTANDSEQVSVLNPQLESANYIPEGTVLRVPVVNQ